MTYLLTATSITAPTSMTRVTDKTEYGNHKDQKIIQNVERHGDSVAFVNPFQPHTGS